MINNRETALHIQKTMLHVSDELQHSVAYVCAQKNNNVLTESEADHYRKVISDILSDILFVVLNPLHEKHPDIKPDGMT